MMKYYRSFDDMLTKHLESGFSYGTFHGAVGATREEVDQWLVDEASFRRARLVGEGLRRRTLEQLLLGKLISLDIFEHLTSDMEELDESAFGDDVINQARERFA